MITEKVNAAVATELVLGQPGFGKRTAKATALGRRRLAAGAKCLRKT